MKYEIKKIPTNQIVENNGQIDGVPPNPRIISEPEFEKLKKSILDNSEMLELREVIVVKEPKSKKYVAICGNMRLRAIRDIGVEEVLCKIVKEATPKQLRSYVLKDNISYGSDDFDVLSEDWDIDELSELGMDFFGDIQPEKLETLDKEPDDKDTIIFKVKLLKEDAEKIEKILKSVNEDKAEALKTIVFSYKNNEQ